MNPMKATITAVAVMGLHAGCVFSVTDHRFDGLEADAGGSPDADPAEVTVVLSAPITWSFDSGTSSYDLETSLITQETSVTVSAAAATSITLNDTMTLESGVASTPVYLAPGANTLTIDIGSADGDLTYKIDIDRGAISAAQLAYVKASNTNASDQFGFSVAVDGDTMVIGAMGEDSSATGVGGDEGSNSRGGSGGAYVFRRTGDRWVQEAYLKASNTGTDDHFGTDVAISGDLIAVGADGEDSNAAGVDGDQNNDSANNSGAVYVFQRVGGTWEQDAYLKASNTGSNDRFGSQVALSGDTLAVGAFSEASGATGIDGNEADNTAASAGAAYVFRTTGGTWAQEAYVKASNTGGGDFFGWSLALDGDHLLVGANGEDSAGGEADNSLSGSGAAYAFRRSGSTWSQVGYLKAPNRDLGDQFGFAVAISQDRLVVGAIQEDSSATGVDGDQNSDAALESGAAYVYSWTGSSWVFGAYLKASNTGGGDGFGSAVGIGGSTIVVGAITESSNATGVNGNGENDLAVSSGAAYVFRYGAVWNQIAYAKASNTGVTDLFGYSVAASTDTVVVAARDEGSGSTGIDGDGANDDATLSGAVYVFR